MTVAGDAAALPLGGWARAGALLGIVVAVDGEEVAVLNPGDRQLARLRREEVEPLPAGTVRIDVAVDLPVPHGLDEEGLRRWVAALVDPVLRARGADAVREAGLDEGAFLPDVRFEVVRAAGAGATCLAGHRTPAPDAAALPCPTCSRLAVSRPTADGRMGGGVATRSLGTVAPEADGGSPGGRPGLDEGGRSSGHAGEEQ